MEPQYRIIVDLQDQNGLTIHPDTAKRKNIPALKKWFLRFGIQALEIIVKTSARIHENEVKLSAGIIESLRIPLSGRYEMRAAGNEIVFGPYIGILAASKKSGLEQIVQPLANYLYDYAHIGGAVTAFSLEGTDPARHTIDGYVYNPDTKQWDQGVFSYPAAVFKIIYVDKRWRNHFQTVFGGRMFNSYVFNKWEMYRWLSQAPGLERHLPDTILCRTPAQLESFLELHRQIYVKPLNGSMGAGIFQVTKTEDHLKIDEHQDGVPRETVLSNVLDLAEFFKIRLKGKKYIAQQALDLISCEGKKIDFRIVMVKNQAGVWNDMCLVAKYGQRGSIVTNILAGATAEVGEWTLEKRLGLSSEEVFRWRKEMSRIALEAAQCIEKFGVHCGNLGIDIAVDTRGRIWIIEINNLNPSPLFALDIGDRPLFYRIKLMNMLYAKRLAGFPEEL